MIKHYNIRIGLIIVNSIDFKKKTFNYALVATRNIYTDRALQDLISYLNSLKLKS